MGDLARIPRNHAWDDPTSAGNTPLRFPLGDLTNSRHVSDPHRPLHKCHRASKVSIASRGLGMSSPTTSTVNTLATTQGNPSAISGIPSYRHNSKTYSTKNTVLYDKELPAKPRPLIRDHSEPPDAVFKSSETTLSPLTARAGDSRSPSDMGSFQTTSSLFSAPGDSLSEVELGIAAITTSQHVDAHALLLKSRSQISSTKEVHHCSPPYIRAPTIYTLAAPDNVGIRSRSLGHIVTQKSGSPVPRRPMASRTTYSRCQSPSSRNKLGLSFDDRNTPAQTNLVPFHAPKDSPSAAQSISRGNIGKAKRAYHSPATISLRHEPCPSITENTRRSETFGTGATIRFSTDAHEVIMGKSHLNTSTGWKARPVTELTCFATPSDVAKLPTSVYKGSSHHQHNKLTTAHPPSGNPSHVQQFLSGNAYGAPRHEYSKSQEVLMSGGTWSPASKAAGSPHSASLGYGEPNGKEFENTDILKHQVSQSRLPLYTTRKLPSRTKEVTSSMLPENRTTVPSPTTNRVPATVNDGFNNMKGMKSTQKPGKSFKGRMSALLLGRRSMGNSADIGIQRNFLPKRSIGAHLDSHLKSDGETGPSAEAIPASPLGRRGYQEEQRKRNIPILRKTNEAPAEDVHNMSRVLDFNQRPESSTKTLNSLNQIREEENSGAQKHFPIYTTGDKVTEHDPFDETGLGHFFDMQLSDAQRNLDHAIEACQTIEDQELKSTVAVIIQRAGDAILVSREARMANIALSNAIAGLVRQSNHHTAAACSAALQCSTGSTRQAQQGDIRGS